VPQPFGVAICERPDHRYSITSCVIDASRYTTAWSRVAVEALADDAAIQEELELDSLDFLTFVEQLSKTSGRRIEESDYDALATKATCIAFLSAT